MPAWQPPMAAGRRWIGTESPRKSISVPNTSLNTPTTHTYTNTVCPEEPPVRRVLPPTLGQRAPEANSCRMPGCPCTRQPGSWSEASNRTRSYYCPAAHFNILSGCSVVTTFLSLISSTLWRIFKV